VSNSEDERVLFWAGRKAAFPAVGRISPDYYCMDGTIPRAKLPLVLKRIRELSEHYGLRVANVFHAGDGNLHPLIPLRRQHAWRAGEDRGIRRRDSEALRRSGRRADRRARRRRRESAT
jgi:FAD/FMN-containing dehydrogenase